MNKFNVVFGSLLMACGMSLNAQQIAKKLVLVEKWSGTWCGPCTGAARALEQMDQENLNIALISYQIERKQWAKDKYLTEEGEARQKYYGGIDHFPTTCFDGTLSLTKGSIYGTVYPDLFPFYQERIALKTSFDLAVSSLNYPSNDAFRATIDVTRVAPYQLSGTQDLKLRVAVVEKNIPQEWQNMHELHYVQRDMYPDFNGVTVSVDQEKSAFVIEGTVNEIWNKDELQLVCYLQDDNTKEVLQTISCPLYRTLIQPKGTHTNHFNNIEYYWYQVANYQDQLDHYNVYSQEGDKLAEVEGDANFFKCTRSDPGGHGIQVSAVYQQKGETEKSPVIEGASYRRNLASAPLCLRYQQQDNQSFLQWDTPYAIQDSCISYRRYQEPKTDANGNLQVDRKGGMLMSDVWVVNRLDQNDTYPFRGLDLCTISFIPGDVKAGYEVGVFKNGRLVVSENVDFNDLTADQWYTHRLAHPVFIGGNDVVEVGYFIRDLSNMPILIDKGPVLEAGKTNLIGMTDDGQLVWDELYKGNNLIQVGFGIPQAQGTYPVDYTFLGYKVYCQGEAVQETLLTEPRFADLPQNGTYYVTAVYDNGESVASNTVAVDGCSVESLSVDALAVTGNTSTQEVSIRGAFQTAALYDLCGKEVVRIASPATTIQVASHGVYLVRVTGTGSGTKTYKVIL